MANVLGELFSEIAGSIRSGLGDIGAMKPSNFPDRIDELVAVMNALANGNGGDGGEEGGVATGETKVETGNFDTANTGVGRQYIRHTLGEIPDFVIVYALNMYSSGMDFSKNNFIAAWSVKSDLYSGGVKGSIMNTDSGSTMLGGLDVAIDNESVDLLSARIYCPDDSTIRVGTDKTDYGGQFGENTQYAWVAVSGMKNVSAPEPVLQDKTITENGEYTADEGFDGLGKVLVDVMQSVSSGELLCKSFSFKPTSTKGVRVEYDIGFNPDVIFVSIEAHKTVTTYNGIVYFGISKAVADKLGSNGTNMILEHSSSSVYRSGYIADIRSDYDASMPISAADATGFNLGKYAPANMYYKCYVIGGLS